MLLHLMLVAVRAICMASPKTVLTELVVVALLASVPEAHHTLTPTVRALHWMEDLKRVTRGKRNNENSLLKNRQLIPEQKTLQKLYPT